MAEVSVIRPVAPTRASAFMLFLHAFVDVVFTPHKKSLKNLGSIPLTIAGITLIDLALFQLGAFWGLLATGLSLIAVEYLIADEAP